MKRQNQLYGNLSKGTYSFANLNNEERELKVEELTEKITHLASNIDNYNAHKVVYRNNYLKPIQ